MLRLQSIFIFSALFSTVFCGSIFEQTNKGRCAPIDIPLCKDMMYNSTHIPNTILQQDQQTLLANTKHFKPLIKTKCHPHLKFFVCSVFAPMCPEQLPQAVTSCRSVCEQVKADCLSILEEFSIGWPEVLNCSRFPELPEVCMTPPSDADTVKHTSNSKSEYSSRTNPFPVPSCPRDLLDIDPTDTKGACAVQCEADVIFRRQDKKVASMWMLVFGSADLVVSMFTFLTFLVDSSRFKFPERSVFYMALCYAFFAIPHLFPLFWNFEQRACDRIATGQTYLVYSGFENTRCVLSFFFTYYFSMAAHLWWLMFAFTWYLSAARKWVPEGIEACSAYVHLIAWGGAALLTTGVLILHKIDASELTGVCSVGNSDPSMLLYFSILPRVLITVVGSLFVLAGLGSMCREGRSFRRRGTDTSKLEKLMLKMGMFCLFYIVPTVVLLVCDWFHYGELLNWSRATTMCKRYGGVDSGKCTRPSPPQSARYLLSLLMSLVGGVSCAIWIISPKTFTSWQRFLCCGMCDSAPQKSSHPVTRPLLEPPVPVAPPPQPPAHYAPLQTGHVWRPSNVV